MISSKFTRAADYRKRTVRVPYTPTTGFTKHDVRVGDYVVFSTNGTERVGRMFASVHPCVPEPGEPAVFIGVAALATDLMDVRIAWVDPKDVFEAHSPQRLNGRVVAWLTGDEFLVDAKNPESMMARLESGELVTWL
jgi:hypothetical protein